MFVRACPLGCTDIRNKFKFIQFLRKKTNTNPKRGPIHERAPSKWFARVVRGMLPTKNRRSREAQARLKTFEGVPPPYVNYRVSRVRACAGTYCFVS